MAERSGTAGDRHTRAVGHERRRVGHPLAAPAAELISWFQVEASAVPGDRPLPVRPFLRCAEDTSARVGALHLSAVQVLLPVQGLDASSRPPYATVPSM